MELSAKLSISFGLRFRAWDAKNAQKRGRNTSESLRRAVSFGRFAVCERRNCA
jgi:hypothetical protein